LSCSETLSNAGAPWGDCPKAEAAEKREHVRRRENAKARAQVMVASKP